MAARREPWRARLERLRAAVAPPLTHTELSLALGLSAPPPGQRGLSDVARFLSDAPRHRHALPDDATGALIEALLAGALFLATRPGHTPDRREVLVCAADDLPRLDRRWHVVHAGTGGRVDPPTWDDPDLWDPFAAPAASPALPSAPRLVAGWPVPAVGLGCMRLSTAGAPDDDTALAVLHAALDAGVRLLDTADVYCTSEDDLHANERRIAAALAAWPGPARDVLVVTKAGLARPGGRWIPDGRPDRLRRRCEGSLAALGLSRLPLLLLHGVDPRVPLEESVTALARLRDDGLVAAVGLCNVTPAQLDAASQITPIDVVSAAWSPFAGGSWPLVVACLTRGVAFLAHSPLGGHARRAAPDPVLTATAARLGVSPERLALAWLTGIAPHVVALPGATRVASAVDSAAAAGLTLGPADQHALDARFGWSAAAREALTAAAGPDVVLLTGAPAAGKTTRTAAYASAGYLRLNRDTLGGSLADLAPRLATALAAGARRVVLDNTFPTRATRAPLIAVARAHGVPVRAEHVDIDRADALVNAAGRVLERMGRLPDPGALRAAGRDDPNLLPPAAITRWFDQAELPRLDEGFDAVRVHRFVRRPAGRHRALLLDYDGTLRESAGPTPFPRSPAEVRLLPGRADVLRRWADAGWRLLGVSNQAGVALGQVDEAAVQATFAHTNALLGLDIDVRYCPHPHAPVGCWCRKPLPGLGVALIRDHDLDASRCLVVGDRDSDRAFADGLGMRFQHAEDFFRPGAGPP